MSSQTEKSPYFIYKYEPLYEDSIDFNKIIIPFSDFGKSTKVLYIHDGIEIAIKFNGTHPIFQAIMLNEFTESTAE